MADRKPYTTRHAADKDNDFGAVIEHGEHAFEGEGPGGEPKWFRFGCPNKGRQVECMVPVNGQKNSVGAGWSLSGDKASPTLSPSIRCHNCGWHGFVRDGQMITCGDSRPPSD